MQLIVQKFGGTSVANIEKIRAIAKIILKEINAGNHTIIIVSAMAGVTNNLITMGHEITKSSDSHIILKKQEYDALLSTGEIVTASLLAMELQNHNIIARSMQAWQAGIISDDNFGNALVTHVDTQKITDLLSGDVIPIIAGFQGVTQLDRITTLGLGGSDTSAAIIAAAIKADRLDIYTDVDGIFSADPRIVHNAKKLNIISNEEMLELSTSGAKVLHPRAALCAMRYQLNTRILSSFAPEKNGTSIVPLSKLLKQKNMEQTQIKAITSNHNLIRVHIEYNMKHSHSYIMNEIYQHLSKQNTNITEITHDTKNRLYIIANLDDQIIIQKICNELIQKGVISNYDINSDIATISIIGYGLHHDIKLKWGVLSLINEKNIRISNYTTSELKITISVNEEDAKSLLVLLHKQLL